MKVGVLLKQVPDTETRIRINATATGIATDGIKYVINPYDEFALEEALKLLDAKKATEVVLFCLGGGAAQADQRIRDGLARGANRGVWLNDAAFEGSDALGAARALSAAVKAEGIQLLLCGKQAVDDDSCAVPAMVAELLGWAGVMFISALEINGGAFKATRDAGKGLRQVVSGNLPAVMSCDKALNVPRYASLPGIMKARTKPIANKKPADLGLDASKVGKAAAVVTDANWGLPPERPKGRILQGEPDQVVKELVRVLRNEAKVL